jgi:hypothetical protein
MDDQMKGGLRSGRYYVFGGSEKGRKTSAIRNIILQSARRWTPEGFVPREDVNIVMLPFENDQGITTWDFVGMLAYEYLAFNQLSEVLWQNKPIHYLCNGEDIQMFVEEDAIPGEMAYREAIQYGIDTLARLNIFIYDSKDENGGLRRFSDLERVVNMHHTSCVQPGQHEIYIVDYAQLVLNEGKLFEDTRLLSGYMLHDIATGMNATAIALTQFNRETNKAKKKGEDTGDVMGTRGGADMEQDCHMYYEVEYDGEKSPGRIKLALRRARRAAGARSNTVEHYIHPASGYMNLQEIARSQ